MKRQFLVFASAILVSLLGTATTRAATTAIDTIIHDGSTWVTTPNIVGIPGAVDIETYKGFSEFVAVGLFGARDYYFDGLNWTFAPMVGANDYIKIANGYAGGAPNGVGIFYGLSSSGRIDKINNNTAVLSTGVVTGLTNPKAIETYSPFSGEFLTVSDEGVRDYFNSGANFIPVSAATDYIELANKGSASGSFFALGSDGRVDLIANDGNNNYTTTNILAAGTLTNPKYIESYDGNNEFVTVSSQGVREYFFSGGQWQFDLMSASPNYIAVVDNSQEGASYWALSVVPEPNSVVLISIGLVGMSVFRSRERRNQRFCSRQRSDYAAAPE